MREAGASTMLARLITRGCGTLDAASARRSRRSARRLARRRSPGRNSFGLAAEWLARSWSQGFDLFADCLLEPALPRPSSRARSASCSTIRVAQQDNPTQVAFRLFSEALYGAHPYHRDVLGTPDSIDDLSRAALAAFYRDRYPIVALVLAIVGDVDVDDAIAHVTKRFAGVATQASDVPDRRIAGVRRRTGRRPRGLSLPRSRAGSPRDRLSRRDDRRAGSVRARAARRRARRPERPAVRRAARQAGARLSRVGALGRGRRSRASSRSTCRARPRSSTPPRPR